jgi:hypothetical protein
LKRVVSISLGTSRRNKAAETEILGEKFSIERIGTDGDLGKFQQMFEELDGKVDALGVGGADIWLVVGERKYAFRQILKLVSGVKRTPVVDGSGLKHTLERETILRLDREGVIQFADQRVLLMSAVDRYGMAQSLSELCPHVLYGDLMFGLGLPIPVRTYSAVETIGRLTLPLITKLPFKWLYPTGDKQNVRTPKFQKHFDWATVIAGDSLFINRYAPDRLDGKTVITQSVRKENIAWMQSAGVSKLITTTPVIGGETFATNVMEGVLISLMNKKPEETTPQDYLDLLQQLDWAPAVMELNP